MIELFARMGFDNTLQSISNVTPSNTSNISSSFESLTNYSSKGGEPFLLGISKFKDKKRFVNNSVDYFISSDISNDNGYFKEEHVFGFSVSSIGFVVITFDTVNNEYPAEIKVGDTIYYPNSPMFLLEFGEYELYKEIQIIRWNKPNKPIVIQGVKSYWDIGSRYILNCNTSNQDRSDPYYPSWGIISNKGELEILDLFGFIEKLRNSKLLVDCPIEIFINVNGREKILGKYYITDAQEGTNQKVQLFFADILKDWQDIQVNGIEVFGNSTFSMKSAIDKYLREYTNYTSLIVFDKETLEHLKKIYVPTFYFESGSLWNVMQKICEATSCYISCDTNGVPKIKFDRWL